MGDIEQRLTYLEDRLAILDVVSRHSRGFDRHDVELMKGCFHDDGFARFGPRTIKRDEYAQFMNEAHKGRFAMHSHHITTHSCEISGDTAFTES